MPAGKGYCISEYRHNQYWAQVDSHISKKVVANPALSAVLGHGKHQQVDHVLSMSVLSKDSAWKRPEASWRKMLFSQPPTDIQPCYWSIFFEKVKPGDDGMIRAGDAARSASNFARTIVEADPDSDDMDVTISGSGDWRLFHSIEDLENLSASVGWSARQCHRAYCGCQRRTEKEEANLDEFSKYFPAKPSRK